MKIGVNSDLNIPVRRSTPKHNFEPGAVTLPHSGVETQNNYQETKETRVVKSEKSEKSDSESDSEAGEAASKAAGVASEAKTVSTSHETNLNVLIIIAGGLAWFLFR